MGCKERACPMPAKPNGLCAGHQWKAPREAPPPGSVDVGKTLDAPIITFESSMRPTTPVTRESVLPAWKRMEEWLVRNPGVPISYADLAKHISRSETTVKTAVSNFPKRFEAPFGMVRLKSWPQAPAAEPVVEESLTTPERCPASCCPPFTPAEIPERTIPIPIPDFTAVEHHADTDGPLINLGVIKPLVDMLVSEPASESKVDQARSSSPEKEKTAAYPPGYTEEDKEQFDRNMSGLRKWYNGAPIEETGAAGVLINADTQPAAGDDLVDRVESCQIAADHEANPPAPLPKSCLTPFTQVPETVASPLPRHGPYSDRLLELMACYGCNLEDGPDGDAMAERMIDDIVQLSETAWNYREAKRITDAALLAANIFGNASYSAMVEAVQPLVQEIRDLRWHIRQMEMRASSPGK